MTNPEHRLPVKYNYMTEITRRVLYDRVIQFKKERSVAQAALGAAAGRESDWHDNAAYDIANEQFNLASARIVNTQRQLERVCIIEPRQEVDDAQLGNAIRIQFVGGTAIEEFTLLGTSDASVRSDWLSNESPLGKSLIGKKAGDHVQFSVEDGKRQLEVILHEILPGNFGA